MELECIREIDAQLFRYLNWDLFKLVNGKVCHLEIGFGNGEYLVNYAKTYPDEVFFGIEYNPKYFRKGLRKTFCLNSKNIFLFCSEAESFLWHIVPDNFFDFVHINFPDPWPKKRHNRRRLINNLFVNELHRVLKQNGVVFLATDFYEYFLNIVSIFSNNNFKTNYLSDKPYALRTFKTKYEKNFENLAISIYYAIFKKKY